MLLFGADVPPAGILVGTRRERIKRTHNEISYRCSPGFPGIDVEHVVFGILYLPRTGFGIVDLQQRMREVSIDRAIDDDFSRADAD